MKSIKNTSESKNYTAINIGKFDDISGYSLIHPKNKQEIKGKIFVKEATKATGTEISFQILLPQTEIPYFHIHFDNEETYIILKGSGDFQIDHDCFPISEGSIIRVAPEGKRGMRNNSDNPMIYMVIQSKENSLGRHTTDDGERVVVEPKWI